jgi:hypothetical protein
MISCKDVELKSYARPKKPNIMPKNMPLIVSTRSKFRLNSNLTYLIAFFIITLLLFKSINFGQYTFLEKDTRQLILVFLFLTSK